MSGSVRQSLDRIGSKRCIRFEHTERVSVSFHDVQRQIKIRHAVIDPEVFVAETAVATGDSASF